MPVSVEWVLIKPSPYRVSPPAGPSDAAENHGPKYASSRSIHHQTTLPLLLIYVPFTAYQMPSRICSYSPPMTHR